MLYRIIVLRYYYIMLLYSVTGSCSLGASFSIIKYIILYINIIISIPTTPLSKQNHISLVTFSLYC